MKSLKDTIKKVEQTLICKKCKKEFTSKSLAFFCEDCFVALKKDSPKEWVEKRVGGYIDYRRNVFVADSK